jgi:hypothetical protein
MALTQFSFDFAPRKKILLSVAIDEIQYYEIFAPMPSAEWFVGLIESNEIEGLKIGGRWYVFADSLEEWIRSINSPQVARAA